ncbi:MAG TPA: hypothetical protein GXX28_08175, partial [Firmicutes bacterium]|nr:hypothetical protein [Bacillota bacterium]
MSRTIAFLSLAGFYAGTARRVYGLSGPFLVGRHGRLCEASPDPALAGLRPGLSRREAAYAAPEARWVEYEPGRFRGAAETFWRRCAELTPFVEPLADHEVFLDLTGLPGDLPPALTRLKDDLRRRLATPELELRAGLATNRLVARLAAERAATGGFLAVPPGQEADFLASQPPSALWTVPAPVRETLSRLGLATLAEVRSVPEPALRRLCGPEAHRLLRHAWGRDDSPVSLLEQAEVIRTAASLRCLEREMEFLSPPSGWTEVAAFLQDAAAALAAELQEKGWQALRLQLTLEPAGGQARRVRTTPREP